MLDTDRLVINKLKDRLITTQKVCRFFFKFSLGCLITILILICTIIYMYINKPQTNEIKTQPTIVGKIVLEKPKMYEIITDKKFLKSAELPPLPMVR